MQRRKDATSMDAKEFLRCVAAPLRGIVFWKWILVVIVGFKALLFNCIAQNESLVREQQLENLADANQQDPEDDSYLLQLEQFRKNPVNLNTANETELKELGILSDLQVAHFMMYRKLLGRFISVYELQAVPLWSIATIRKLLPFITITTTAGLTEELKKRFSNGEHRLLLRMSQVMERSEGFQRASATTRYNGSPQRIFMRYRYSYKNLLQYGGAGDKDAGEQFFKGTQRTGFDFYSFHLFARNAGIVQSLAIGDFTINMGQGLIHWQSLAFKKSGETINVKRQSPVLRPYNSAGEFYFHRGAGITIRKAGMESTVFVSLRKLDANIETDTTGNKSYISSILNSGYHRTAGESLGRNVLTQTTFGGNVIYRGNQWHIGLNGVHFNFSLPLQKRDEPYNLYAINGERWYNLSIDYSYTYKNIHFFGEAACDRNFNAAFVNGFLMSVDPRVDISFVQRTINAAYQAVYGNAFTENTYPTNEKGFYTGISIRPIAGLRMDAYADIFIFPWLKYQVNAPGNGTDWLVQFIYTPNKQAEVYTRFRTESRPFNVNDGISGNSYTANKLRQSWQTQVSCQLNKFIVARSRMDIVWFDKRSDNKETGFLAYLDLIYKPLGKKYNGVLRLQYFETGGYNSRIYAYENDVLYSNSIPAFFQKGFRYYISLSYDVTKRISCWFRYARVIYPGQPEIGSGSDMIKENKKTEIKMQVLYTF
jgi:hypothetical protein